VPFNRRYELYIALRYLRPRRLATVFLILGLTHLVANAFGTALAVAAGLPVAVAVVVGIMLGLIADFAVFSSLKESFVVLITLLSIVGVSMGVMALTITLSVMTGFEEDLRDRILGFNPHVLVMSHTGSVQDYPGVMERIYAIPGVTQAAPFVYGQVMISSGENVAGVLVRGILPIPGGADELDRHLREGQVQALAVLHAVPLNDGRGATVELPGIILGTELARQVDAKIGDPVTLVSPISTPSAVGLVPRVKRFVYVGTFDSGMSEYDSGLAYINLTDAQHFFGLGDRVTGLDVRVKDLYQARVVAERIASTLGFPYRVRDWMEVNRNLFSALKLEKTVYFMVLLLIILVGAFTIVATLIMVVMEKRKDVAILKSMGATRAGIGRIFVFKGLVIGALGTAIGNLAGYAGCVALRRYHFIDLPPGVFYVSTVPVKMYAEYFAAVTVASMAICLLATIYPAFQAARLAPVDVIRYE
jgi:lipoprotein-releasing system permease protein